MPLWYILSVQGSGFRNSIEASNYFFETGYFREIDPAFMFNFAPSCVNDPMFNQQWGLRNTGQSGGRTGVDINVCFAWTITRGAGVNVAVLDTPIDPNHNDLRANFHPLSFDAQSGRSPSVNIGTDHGTHVAGIVAAVRDNRLQVAGVAPESRIMRISHGLSATSTASAELASGISWAWQNGADVINNSWGDQGGQHHSVLRSAALENAIVNAMTQGRNGLGAIVIFASGNWGVIDYPAWFHPDILVVGAVDRHGRRSVFPPLFNIPRSSGFGTQLDVVAPGSDIYSTGANNRTLFDSGTSMAAPHVAGVAALMLSVNPTLTGQQVRNIIKSTANRNSNVLPGVTFSTVPGRPALWNSHVGHGLVNAYAAVREAVGLRPNISGPAGVCPGTANAVFELQNHPANTTIRWTADAPLAIVGANNLDRVTVRHTGATTPLSSRIRAEIILNGQVVHTVVREVVVSRPVVTSIVPPHQTLHAGSSLVFTANHTGTSLTWSVSPNTGVGIGITGNDNVRTILFTHPGTYTISVTSTNACGSYTRHLNVNVVSSGPPSLTFACPLCGFYPLQDGMHCPCIIGLRRGSDGEIEVVEEVVEQQQ